MPKVTVLLFSYNHEKFIRACMDSVLAQTFRDFELIVIDDCSTDATWEIVQSGVDVRRDRPVRHGRVHCRAEQ